MVPRWARIALLDMDGVLSDFERRVVQLVRQRHPHVRFLNPQPNPWPFYIEDAYPPQYRDLVNAIMREPGFFASLPLIQDALEGWQRIKDAGFEPRICSSPLLVPHCEAEKRRWLLQKLVPHFGPGVLSAAIISREKHRHQGAVLIEDRPPPMKDSHLAVWEHVVFDRPCNRVPGSEAYIRLNGWRDPMLAEKLRLAAERAVRRHQRRSRR